MNLALSALLIILFLLPAFSFRIGVSLPTAGKKEATGNTHDIISRNVSKALSKLNFTETIFLFSAVPVLMHMVSLLLIKATGFKVDYSLLLNIFSGKQNVLTDSSNSIFHYKLLLFLLYTLIETFISCFLGWFLIKLCGGKRWLLKILMGNKVWFKLFSGFALSPVQKDELANILVEVLIETKESSVIYSGLLKNYEIADNTDDLAYITLAAAFRRDFRKEQLVSKQFDESTHSTITTSTRYDIEYGDIISIPGHTFTILGKEIVNVNVTYMKQQVDQNTNTKMLVPIKFD